MFETLVIRDIVYVYDMFTAPCVYNVYPATSCLQSAADTSGIEFVEGMEGEEGMEGIKFVEGKEGDGWN